MLCSTIASALLVAHPTDRSWLCHQSTVLVTRLLYHYCRAKKAAHISLYRFAQSTIPSALPCPALPYPPSGIRCYFGISTLNNFLQFATPQACYPSIPFSQRQTLPSLNHIHIVDQIQGSRVAREVLQTSHPHWEREWESRREEEKGKRKGRRRRKK